MPDPFITEQDIVDLLGRGGTADPGLTIVCDAACDMVRTLIEQDVNASTSTVTLDGTGTDALILPQIPVSAAGTVVVNGGTVTDYVLNDNGVLFRKRLDPSSAWCGSWDGSYRTLMWPRGRQNVTVTFDHGWADADIPRDIKMVALAVATRMFVQGPVTSQTIGRQIAVTYGGKATDFTDGEKIILAKYARYHV